MVPCYSLSSPSPPCPSSRPTGPTDTAILSARSAHTKTSVRVLSAQVCTPPLVQFGFRQKGCGFPWFSLVSAKKRCGFPWVSLVSARKTGPCMVKCLFHLFLRFKCSIAACSVSWCRGRAENMTVKTKNAAVKAIVLGILMPCLGQQCMSTQTHEQKYRKLNTKAQFRHDRALNTEVQIGPEHRGTNWEPKTASLHPQPTTHMSRR